MLDTKDNIHVRDSGWKDWKNPFGIQNAIIKETGGGGKCQFSSVAESLYPMRNIDSSMMRRVVASQVMALSKEAFDMLLLSYRLEKENGEFRGQWDPSTIDSKRAFADLVTKPNRTGDDMSFWGDDHTLRLLGKGLGIRIYVLEQIWDKVKRRMTPYIIEHEPEGKRPKFAIMLWYDQPGGHYQSVGVQYDQGKKTIFTMPCIPKELAFFKTRQKQILEHERKGPK